MNLTNNTILITSGGSGIGRGLAEAFHALGNKIIIAGRRQQALEETTDANPGMAFVTVDINDPNAIRSFAADVTELHPTLNVLINNAGIMRPENLSKRKADSLAKLACLLPIPMMPPIATGADLSFSGCSSIRDSTTRSWRCCFSTWVSAPRSTRC